MELLNNKKLLADCIEWDTVNWSKALVYWENHGQLTQSGLRCLELGGRRGGLSLWMALKDNLVVCSDLQSPEEKAKPLHQKYNVLDHVTYQSIDATNIPYENHFDIVMFKSILGGISRNGNSHLNQIVIDQIYKALKPGGRLLFAENLEASRVHRFLRKKLVPWGASWNYLNIETVPTLFAKFAKLEYDTAGFLGAFGYGEFQRKMFGTIDSFVFDKVMNGSQKYIIFGVAKKG